MPPIPSSVKQLITTIQSDLPVILKDNLFGIYIYGSLSYNAFNPKRSDIDCVVVLNRNLTATEFTSLKLWYKKLLKNTSWAKRLELPFIRKNKIITDGTYNYKTTTCFFGKLIRRTATDADSPITWLNIQECGITLYGPKPATFVPKIKNSALKNALKGEWTYIKNHCQRWNKKSLEYQVYIIATLCRILYTLKNNSLTSKENACQWCLNNMAPEWSPLIKLAIKNLDKKDGQPNPLLVPNLTEFVTYTDQYLIQFTKIPYFK